MKKTVKLTVCAFTAALATVLVLSAYFPYVTYAAPAIAGLMMLVPLIEINIRWAFGAYAASILPVFLLAEPEAKLLYIFFFGWYPLAKAIIERINHRWLEWIIKIIVFNAAIIVAYAIIMFSPDFSIDEFEVLGKYGIYIFLALGNIVFILYDIAIARTASYYLCRLHPRVKKIFSSK